jgi:iron complex outermembrane receptor protein
VEESTFDVPASIDVVGGNALREMQPRVNLSEGMGRVPGLVMQNRYNYAQDLQVSSRGFGARASFGTRGVRLVQDGIPLTMPDGQGQTALFDLDNVERVEMLRGPFTALYGNSSGGVLQAFTAGPPAAPFLEVRGWRGSYDSWRSSLRAGGTVGPLGIGADVARFMTDGYRDHSAATRDSLNARLQYQLTEDAQLTIIGNGLNQPDALDPLGLTQAQLDRDRRQAGTGALAFNTRKSVAHQQGGIAFEQRLTPQDTVRVRGYTGTRWVTQYLAFSGAALNSSGGVVDLNRDFGGASAQWARTGTLAQGDYNFTLGLDYDRMNERRKGYVNDFGVQGALRRDEDDVVWNFDQYAIGEWRFAPKWKLSGGVRHANVTFESTDYYITPQNPNDSGSVRYSHTSPVGGLLYELTPAVHLYGAAGGGFETPTFAELAYRPDGRPGLNFSLQPATLASYELGAKALIGDRTRVNVAIFLINTKNEIVNGPQLQSGRNTFVNAGRTRRTGTEIALETVFGAGFTGNLAYTWINAEFEEFTAPSGRSFAGNKLPGVPQSVFYAELTWRYAPAGFTTVLEGRYNAKVYVDDANSAAAQSYTLVNWRAGFEQRLGRWRFQEFAAINNLTNREYVGSVIVNAANGQYYEPSPTRNWLVGASVTYQF